MNDSGNFMLNSSEQGDAAATSRRLLSARLAQRMLRDHSLRLTRQQLDSAVGSVNRLPRQGQDEISRLAALGAGVLELEPVSQSQSHLSGPDGIEPRVMEAEPMSGYLD